MTYREVSEIRDGMRIDWDMPITMDDGTVLRCDIYRPIKEGRHPVIMTLGPYGKWLHFDDLYASQWRRMCEAHPDVPVYIYDAGHGFNSDRPDHHNEAAATIARQRTLELFRANGG